MAPRRLLPALALTASVLRQWGVSADNTINSLEPQLVDPIHGDFRPRPGGNVFNATTYPMPDFGWDDAPQHPAVPPGNFSNQITLDFGGAPRAKLLPGAVAGSESDIIAPTALPAGTPPPTEPGP